MDNFDYYVFSNYLACIQKFNDSSKAYEQTKFALKRLLCQFNFNAFTNTFDVRNSLINLSNTPKSFRKIFCKKYIDTLLTNGPRNESENFLYGAITVTQDNHGQDFVLNSLGSIFLYDPSLHREADVYRCFSSYAKDRKDVNYRQNLYEHLSINDMREIMLDTALQAIIRERQNQLNATSQNIEETISATHSDKISNFKVNNVALNLCQRDILEGKQQLFKHAEYSDVDLYACMDVGNVRKRQEDSTLILTHPNNPKFKMLVVADGCGGHHEGNFASAFIVRNIMEWFENLSPNYFYEVNTNRLEYEFRKEIEAINTRLYRYGAEETLSTFVGAIVNEKNTVVANVGDSRAYIYDKSKKLQQLTDDHNVSYILWKNGDIKKKDDIRFHRDSNKITRAIGSSSSVKIDSMVIDNSSYSVLMLFSDGITDCLSDEKIKAITKKTPVPQLAKALVEASKTTRSVKSFNKDPQYKDEITPGKDNSSIVIFDNSSKKDDGR